MYEQNVKGSINDLIKFQEEIPRRNSKWLNMFKIIVGEMTVSEMAVGEINCQ